MYKRERNSAVSAQTEFCEGEIQIVNYSMLSVNPNK